MHRQPVDNVGATPAGEGSRPRVPAPKARAARTLRATLRVSAATRAGRYYVIACAPAVLASRAAASPRGA